MRTVRSSTSAGSGHPTSSLSAADLMAVLLARHPPYDWSAPADLYRAQPGWQEVEREVSVG